MERKQQQYGQDFNATILSVFDKLLFPIQRSGKPAQLVSKSLDMTRDTSKPFNGEDQIDPAKVHRRIDYEHPLFDLAAIHAQKCLPELRAASEHSNTLFCGAWTRYGFHEDGFMSAVDTCTHLLGGDPWTRR